MLKAVVLAVSLQNIDRFLHRGLDLGFLRLLARRPPISFREVVEILCGLCEKDFLLHVLRIHIRRLLGVMIWGIPEDAVACKLGAIVVRVRYIAVWVACIFDSILIE